MARIISSRKKYVPVKDLVVYPSKTETIEVIPDDGFNGAHRYRARMCAGFVNGKTKYVDATDTIQFVHKHEDEMFDYLKDISEFGHENPHN